MKKVKLIGPREQSLELTKKQIMELLDKEGIKYNPKSKKEELRKLVVGK